MPKATRKARRFMSAEEFVRAWQTAPSFDAFFAKYRGTSRAAARVRASSLRRRGIALRVFDPRVPVTRDNTRRLVALAKSLGGRK